MLILFKASSTMDNELSWNNGYESRIIRMSQLCRDMCRLNIGDYIFLKMQGGSHKVFQIDKAFAEDLTEQEYAYVTNETYEKLALSPAGEQEVALVEGITLGCDPEFFLVSRSTGNVVSANRYFAKMGQLGNDGMLMELRPNPSTNEYEVVRHIKSLFTECRRRLNQQPEGKDLMMYAASGYSALTAGFHLHYGLPRGLLGWHRQTKTVARLMTAAADYYVGVPNTIIEGDTDVKRRTLKFVPYGKPGGFRLDRRTFEYRLPGGTMLRHPILSAGLMALGAVVVEDLVSRINECTDCFTALSEMASYNDLLALYPRTPREMYSIICSPSAGPARAHLGTIIDDVRKMVGYSRRAGTVERFFRILLEGTQFSNDIEQNWEVRNEEPEGRLVFLQSGGQA
jgi:hypothetical protein